MGSYCNNPKCKRVHYIKPEMSSVFTHKEYADGRIEFLDKPIAYVENPDRVFPDRDWPIDYRNYELRKKGKR